MFINKKINEKSLVRLTAMVECGYEKKYGIFVLDITN